MNGLILVMCAVALICLAFAYISAREDAYQQAARYAKMTRRVRELSMAVNDFRLEVDDSFEETDQGVVDAANRVMGVLGKAMVVESDKIQDSVGKNRDAIRALQQLTIVNDRSLRELMNKLSTEERALVVEYMNDLEKRHVELVRFLASDGSLGVLATSMAAAAVGTESFTVEHFDNGGIQSMLDRVGINMTQEQIMKLDEDLKTDVSKGMTLQDAMYNRLFELEPVIRKVKEFDQKDKILALTEDEKKLDNRFSKMQTMILSHNQAIRDTMGAQSGQLQTLQQGVNAQLGAVQNQVNSQIKSLVDQNLTQISNIQQALSKVTNAPVTGPVFTPSAPGPVFTPPPPAAIKGQWSVTATRPVIWMDGTTWANGVWKDKSGSSNDSRDARNINVKTDGSFSFLYGGTDSGLQLSNGWPQGEYTFVHLTKYNGGTRGRIWNGARNNWLSGHHDRTAGRVHHNRWLEPLINPGVPQDEWLLVVDQRSFARLNAKIEGRAEGANPGAVGINMPQFEAGGERSDWACAEVLVFDGNLSQSDMAAVEKYFIDRYKLPFGAAAPQPAPAPVTVSVPGKLVEQKYRGYYNDNLGFFDAAQKDGNSSLVTSIRKGDEGSQYSYRWSGMIKPQRSGGHEFWTRSDDASHVLINGQVVVDNRGVHPPQDRSGAIELNSGTTYRFDVFFGENEGGAEMWLQWHGPGQDWQTELAPILVSGGEWSATSTKPVIWMDGNSWESNVWRDKSGRGNNSGGNQNVSKASSAEGFAVIQGGTSSGLELTAGWPKQEFTFVHLTRYNGGQKNRIWNGKGGNWLSGHWGGRAGVAHHDGAWAGNPDQVEPQNNWLLTVTQREFSRFNAGRSGRRDGAGNPQGFGINQFGGQYNGEVSDWQCAEVVVFEGNLSDADMKRVEAYFIEKYKLPFRVQ